MALGCTPLPETPSGRGSGRPSPLALGKQVAELRGSAGGRVVRRTEASGSREQPPLTPNKKTGPQSYNRGALNGPGGGPQPGGQLGDPTRGPPRPRSRLLLHRSCEMISASISAKFVGFITED